MTKFKCPNGKAKTIEECRAMRTSVEFPNGKPQGAGLIEQMKHLMRITPQCLCFTALLDILDFNDKDTEEE